MGRNIYDEYLDELEDEIEALESGSLEECNLPDDEMSRGWHRRSVRKAIELHQERRRLRRDLEFFPSGLELLIYLNINQ